MYKEQLAFIEKGQFDLLDLLRSETPQKWGVMNAQQMIEHVRSFYNVSSGKLIMPLLTPEEHLPKYREFLYSEKQFRENTKAPKEILGDDALPVYYPDLDTAKQKLRESIESFFGFFKNDPQLITVHPVFGPLNFEDWVRLHYKHVTHHWRQFGLMA